MWGYLPILFQLSIFQVRVFEAIAQKEGKLMSQSFPNRNWPVRPMITSYFDKMVFDKITRIGVLFL